MFMMDAEVIVNAMWGRGKLQKSQYVFPKAMVELGNRSSKEESRDADGGGRPW